MKYLRLFRAGLVALGLQVGLVFAQDEASMPPPEVLEAPTSASESVPMPMPEAAPTPVSEVAPTPVQTPTSTPFPTAMSLLATVETGTFPAEETGPILASVMPHVGKCSCCCDCCCCGPQGHFIGGTGLYLIQPFFTSNTAYFVVAESRRPGERRRQVTDRVDLSHDMSAAPLAWLGYESASGLGVRGRWWYFRQGSDQTLTFPPSVLGTNLVVISAVPLGMQAFSNTDRQQTTAFAVTSNLLLQVGDIEAFQNVRIGPWDLLFSGGVRMAHINQHYNVYSGDTVGDVALWRTIQSGHSFHGAGPVLAVEARRPLGGMPLSLYGSARGAVLFGSAKQNAIFLANTLRNDDANPSEASDHRDRVLPVGELEVGVEYSQSFGPARLFGQVAMVGQEWFSAGNASRSANHAFPSGFPVGGPSVDSDFGFFGLAFRLGMNY